MGYAVYEDHWARGRWAGYGVPAECDWPDCHEKIDRGLGYKCEEHISYTYLGFVQADGTVLLREEDAEREEEHIEEGCGLFFCEQHLHRTDTHGTIERGKPDSPEWIQHMLTDPSWAEWRSLHPDRVLVLRSNG